MVVIDLFYTICTDYPQALTIYEQQMARLTTVGLVDVMRSLTIIVAGNNTLPYEHLSWKAKIKIIQAPVAKEGEFTTLFEILRRAQEEDFYALYFHCKGCTHDPTNLPVQDWRELLEYFLLDQWPVAVAQLATNNSVGVNQTSYPVPHYNGNFWWARSDYLRRLPNPRDCYLAYYNVYTTLDESEKHHRLLSTTGFDAEFVRLTYPPQSKLPILPNLTAFIREYGFDWLWYTRHVPTARGLTAEEALEHWKRKGEESDYTSFYRLNRRINAETWIQRNGGRHLSLYDSNCSHYTERCPSDLYRTPNRQRIAVFLPEGEEPHNRYDNNATTEYRIFLNLGENSLATARHSLYVIYPHATFTCLETPEQLVAFESWLRKDPSYDAVVVVPPTILNGRRLALALKAEERRAAELQREVDRVRREIERKEQERLKQERQEWLRELKLERERTRQKPKT